MDVQSARGNPCRAGVAVAACERRDSAGARLVQRPRARQARRGQSRAVHRVAAGACQRAGASDRAASQRHRANRVAVGGEIEHATIDRHTTGAQSIGDAVGERAAAHGRQAGVGVRCRERQHTAAIFGQRAGTRADRAADRRVPRTAHREREARAGDRAAVERQQAGVGIDSSSCSKRHRAGPGVAAADVAQGAPARHARTAQRQRPAQGDSILLLQVDFGIRGHSHGSRRAKSGAILQIENTGIHRSGASECTRSGQNLRTRSSFYEAHRAGRAVGKSSVKLGGAGTQPDRQRRSGSVAIINGAGTGQPGHRG